MVNLESEVEGVEEKQQKTVEYNHRWDTLVLLLYLILITASVLTIWLFKHKRFRFFHETGLSIIYGLIVGAVIRYAAPASQLRTRNLDLPPLPNSTFNDLPPDRLVLRLQVEDVAQHTNESLFYEYRFKHQLKQYSVTKRELDEKMTFNPEIFFNLLLPPIIFCAGYSMKRKHFFRNIGAIITYSFIGTIISCLTVGGICFAFTRIMPELKEYMPFNDCLLFGALISATDPVTVLAIFNDLNVDVDLYAIVFGESVFNDAVAIVLSQSIEKYGSLSHGGVDGKAILSAFGSFMAIFWGAFGIGSAMGLLTALLTKYTHIKDYPLLETALFFLMSYSTFLSAEAAGFSGIVAVLFCGITQAHYTFNNLSEESKSRTKELFEVLNFLAENFVFTYIGVSTFTFQQHYWHPGFIFVSFLAILVGRALNVYPLSFLLNLGRSNKITINKQHMSMFSGLRGAIAFALAIRNTSSDMRRMIFSTTLVIVIATVILCGGLTTQMLQWLKIKVGVNEDTGHSVRSIPPHFDDGSHERLLKSHRARPPHVQGDITIDRQVSQESSDIASLNATHTRDKGRIVRIWSGFDSKYLKPLLTHAQPLLTETLPRCCLPLAQILTTEEQLMAVNQVDKSGDAEFILQDAGRMDDISLPRSSTSDILQAGSVQLIVEDNAAYSNPMETVDPESLPRRADPPREHKQFTTLSLGGSSGLHNGDTV